MPPNEPNDEERQEELPQDGQTPFSPADDTPQGDGTLDDTHPATDSGVQPEEVYEEGVAGAAEASEPNADGAVADFTPPAGEDDKSDDDDDNPQPLAA